MAKAKSYKLQGREWTVKDLAEELGLSTPRVHGLLKEHNEDIKAIFASRGITPKPADKGPKARLFDYKGNQWTVKQLAEEFGLSNVRVNNLIKEFDGDIEKIASSREKSKKTAETEKAPKTEKTVEKTDIAVDEKESKSLELDLEDKVSFEGIEIDQSITSLKIINAEKLTDISALASLKNLNELDLSWCEKLTDISALASLKNLNELDLSACVELTDISALASLKNLKVLRLYRCFKLTDISALASLENLEALYLKCCKKLTDISALASLKNLKQLDISLNGFVLTDISALASLKNLNELFLNDCYKLTDISALASLENLKKLDLKRCEELTDISALASLENLEYLDLSDCPKIKDIDVLKSLTKTDISFDETEKDENDEPSVHYEKWENLREHIYGIGQIEGSRYMEIADENEYNAFKQSYENHPDFGEEYTNFLNKYSEEFNNDDLDRENLAALFFDNDDLSDDFKDYILRQMAP